MEKDTVEKGNRFPKSCFGVKCMQKDCFNLASHKVGEENPWDRADADEEKQSDTFFRQHNLTTYLCDLHFNTLMKRDEKYYDSDPRFSHSPKNS